MIPAHIKINAKSLIRGAKCDISLIFTYDAKVKKYYVSAGLLMFFIFP